MKPGVIIIGIILTTFTYLQGQHLIGLPKDEVKKVMKKDMKDFSQDQTIVRQKFNYLKYVNDIQTITFIIFFSDDDISVSTKKVCDYIEYDFVVDDLNNRYRKRGKNRWIYSHKGEKYIITLEEKDWYFTLRETAK